METGATLKSGWVTASLLISKRRGYSPQHQLVYGQEVLKRFQTDGHTRQFAGIGLYG